MTNFTPLALQAIGDTAEMAESSPESTRAVLKSLDRMAHKVLASVAASQCFQPRLSLSGKDLTRGAGQPAFAGRPRRVMLRETSANRRGIPGRK